MSSHIVPANTHNYNVVAIREILLLGSASYPTYNTA